MNADIMQRGGFESRRPADDSERLLEILLSTSSDLIFVTDRANRYLHVSQTGADILGGTRQEILGKTASDFGLPSEFVQTLNQERENVFVAGEAIWDENMLPGRDGQIHFFQRFLTPLRDAGGQVTAVVSVTRDITDSRRAEASLRMTEENLALAVGAAHLGTFYCDWPFDNIHWNETCKQHFFLPPDAQINFDLFYALLHPDDREPTRAAIDRAIEEHGEYNVEYRVPAPDGALRWINAIGRGFYDAQGVPVRFDGVTLDITERKQNEEEQERLRQLAEARAVELAEVYQREHRIAEALQRSLLYKPRFLPAAPVEVETIYKPASDEADVGGDYYDVFALDGGKLALVVGDVSGKGLEAASRTAEIKYTLRAYLREYPHAAPALQRLNAFLCEAQRLEDAPWNYFVCITVIILDITTGSAQVASGGAEPPLVLRTSGRIEEIMVSGLPMGVENEAFYEAQAVTLAPGDLLLLVTDGITEARQGHEFLGWEGMTRLAQEARGAGTLQELGQAVFAGAELYAGGRLKDDACLLLARRV